jgi:hypothetical protein
MWKSKPPGRDCKDPPYTSVPKKKSNFDGKRPTEEVPHDARDSREGSLAGD